MNAALPYAQAQQRAERQPEIISAAMSDPSIDIDKLVRLLAPLPDLDPLARPDALSYQRHTGDEPPTSETRPLI